MLDKLLGMGVALFRDEVGAELWRLFAFGEDSGTDGVDVVEHLVVGEADDAVAAAAEFLRALRIGCGLAVVDFAVDFNDEVVLGAVEVDDVWADGMLPPKLEQPQPLAPQPVPKLPLGYCQPLAQIPSLLANDGRRFISLTFEFTAAMLMHEMCPYEQEEQRAIVGSRSFCICKSNGLRQQIPSLCKSCSEGNRRRDRPESPHVILWSQD